MKQVFTLLDSASTICGGDAKLAERLGVAHTVVSDMRHSRRTITPETAAELADIAHVDPLQAMADAVIERNRGTRRESVLREILGKALAGGAVVLLSFSYSGDSISATRSKTSNTVQLPFVYIV
jgi:transcriptional regulator with XRE-family HTH domain